MEIASIDTEEHGDKQRRECGNCVRVSPSFADAYDATLRRFKLKAVDIADEADIRDATISEFRRGGRDIKQSTLLKIVGVLPNEAYLYFYRYLATRLPSWNDESETKGKSEMSPADIILSLIEECRDEDIPKILRAVGKRAAEAIERASLDEEISRSLGEVTSPISEKEK